MLLSNSGVLCVFSILCFSAVCKGIGVEEVLGMCQEMSVTRMGGR